MYRTLKSVFFISGLFCLFSYACKDKKYFGTDAVVIESKHRHWGKGFYKVDVYYKYLFNNDSILASATLNGMTRASYALYYHPGDSLKIGYNPTDSSDTFILEKVYDNRPVQEKTRGRVIYVKKRYN